MWGDGTSDVESLSKNQLGFISQFLEDGNSLKFEMDVSKFTSGIYYSYSEFGDKIIRRKVIYIYIYNA